MRVLRGLVALWLAATCMTVLAQTQVLPDFTRLVEEQGSAVVNISTTQAVRRTSALPQIPGMEDDEIQEFFRRFIPRQQPACPARGQGRAPRAARSAPDSSSSPTATSLPMATSSRAPTR